MKIDKKTITIIILLAVILAGVVFVAYNIISARAYNLGYQDATIIINQQVTANLQQNGYIVFMYPINETATIPIKLIPQQNG